ncbi:hypothetical protein VCHA53O466_140019 [Vibrio chagasii]|nr:hypothetical protein VCHA53O466_140019 [Vibrio chagasii]
MNIEIDSELPLGNQTIKLSTKPNERSVSIANSLGFGIDLEQLNLSYIPSEACDMFVNQSYEYVAIDTLKFDSYHKLHSIDMHLPEYITDLLDSNFSIDPFDEYNKSLGKLLRLSSTVKDNKLTMHCPVLAEHSINFSQGRHRFWMIRACGAPFFIAAVLPKVKQQLIEANMLFDTELISVAV